MVGWRNTGGFGGIKGVSGRKAKQLDRKMESWKPPTKIDGKKGKF